MKKTNKLLAVILAVLMIMSVLPLTAFADTPVFETDDGFLYTMDGNGQYATIVGYTGNETKITVPSSVYWAPSYRNVLWIGEGAFEGNENLTDVSLSEGIRSIGKDSFKDCANLRYLRIPQTVVSVIDSFYEGCDSLTNIYVLYNKNASYDALEYAPVYFQVREDEPSWNTRNLKNVKTYRAVANTDTMTMAYYSDANGCLYSNDKTVLWRVPSGNCPASFSVSNVQTIESYAFGSCDSLLVVSIPESVEKVKKNAFYNCDSIDELSVHVTPKIVTDNVNVSYKGVEGLITTIYISKNTLFEMGCYDFLLDSAIRFEVDSDHPLYDTSDGLLYSKNFETLLCVLPSRNFTSFTVSSPTTGIGDYAFYGCKTLTSVRINEGVTCIGDNAFLECKKLKTVSLPSTLKTIGASAFEEAQSLSEINIPDGVEKIGEWAFCGCSSLKSIVLPSQLAEIEQGAFDYCFNLESVVIPDGITEIRDYAFHYCEHLKEVTIPFSVQEIDTYAFDKDYLETIYGYENSYAQEYALDCGFNFVSLGETECQHSRTLEVTTEATCTEDGKVETVCAACGEILGTRVLPAFGHDWSEPEYEWNYDNSKVTATRSCANDETHIETETVETASKIIVEAIPEIGQLGITEYTAEFENPVFEKQVKRVETDESIYTSANGLWKYKKLYDGSVILTSGSDTRAYLGNKAVLNIPEAVDGMTVSGLGDYAFVNCSFITKLTVPNCITTVGTSAFEGCGSLEAIALHDNILELGSRIFANCSSLKTVSIPLALKKMGEEAFINCTSLENMDVYVSFDSYTLPNKTFSGCTSLKSVSLGVRACRIGDYAFENCTSLTEVNFPSTAYTQIGNYAFLGCSSLECLHIKYWLTVIGKQAFTGCKKLSDIYYFNSQENWEKINISPDNEMLDNVKIHYNVTGDHEYTVSGYKPATCTEDGILYYTCPCGYEKQEIVPAPGHNWGDTVYEWDSDNRHVTATRICQRDNEHIETETVRTSVVEIEATCDMDGKFIYTATFSNPAFATQQRAVPSGISAGHRWGNISYTWAADNSTVTAIRVCQIDSSHVETETANVTFELVKPATTTQTGLIVYTAEFENKAFGTVSRAVTIPKIDDSGKTFPDVKEGDWFYDAVNYVSEKGYITGYDNGSFGPSDALQRQDFVVILARIAGADLNKYAGLTPSFSDVRADAYYASAVIWAFENKIINGYDNGNFGVGDKVTREQVCTILYRYLGQPSAGDPAAVLAAFSDRGKVSSFAENAMAWAVENGIISGKNATTLAPSATASRAEIATIIMRMDQKEMFTG